MPRSFHHSLHFEYSLFPPKMRWLFIGHLLRGAVQQTVGLFIPIFLYLHAETFPWWSMIPLSSQWGSLVRGVLIVCVYYIVMRLCVVCIAFPIARVIKVLGLVKSMIVGNMMLLVLFITLSFTEVWPILYIITPILSAVEVAFYWTSYHTLFSVNADLQKLGQEVGSLQFLDRLMRAGLPMIGGLVAGTFGFQVLNILGAILLFGASICLVPMHETTLSFQVTFGEFMRWIKHKISKNIILGFVGKYVDNSSLDLWTIYAFVFFGTVERVGYVFSIVLFLSLFISYFMGWYLGKHKGRKAFFLSGGLLSIVWWAKMFIQSTWHFLAFDVMDRLTSSVFIPLFDTFFYKASHGKMVFHFYVFREIILSLTGIVFWSVIALLFILPFQWVGVFALASVGTLLSLNMAKDRE